MTQLNIELVLGREVRSRDGKRLGHIEAIHLARDGDSLFISEFHIGPDALLERLAVGLLPQWLREVVHRRNQSRRHRLAWDQMDLSDPRHPRLICDEAQLIKHAHAGDDRA